MKSTRLPPLQTDVQNLILEEDGEEHEDGTTSFSGMLHGDPLLSQKAANVRMAYGRVYGGSPKKQMRSEVFCLHVRGGARGRHVLR